MKKSIVYIYNSFADPLFQGNLFQHLLIEARKKRFVFFLITFEHVKHRMSNEEIIAKKEELKAFNIYWYPLNWHSGRFILFKKGYDLIVSFLVIVRLHIKETPSSIISLGTISGSFAYIIKKIFGYVHYAYQYEPHSQFMADFGIWPKSSLQYKLLNFFERKTAESAELIATGTDALVLELKSRKNVKGSIFKLPSCVNEKYFNIDPLNAESIKSKLGIMPNEKVVIYIGKFGGIYFDKEIFDLFQLLNQSILNLYFIVLTPDANELIDNQLRLKGITRHFIAKSAYMDVYKFLNAADFGISAIPGYESQKFRSPIKVGEYLLCGVPFLTCSGVSEDDLIAERHHVGVVVQSFSKEAIEPKIEQIESFLNLNDRHRIRSVGESYRGLSFHIPIIDQIFGQLYEH